MPVDTSIYNAFIRPIRSVQEYEQDAENLAGSRQQNALRALQVQAGTRGEQDAQRVLGEQSGVRNALSALGGNATADQRINALRALATPTALSQADAMEKGYLERQKTDAEVGSKKAGTATSEFDLRKKRFDFVLQGLTSAGNADEAKQYLVRGVQRGDISFEEAQQMATRTPADPAAYGQWQRDAIMRTLDAKEQMRFTQPDANAQLQAQTSAASNVASNARMLAEGAANRAVTVRGQNMVDARAGAKADAVAAKPMPATAVRLQNDELTALGTFKGLDADLGALETQITSGELPLGPIRNLESRGRNFAGLSTQGSRNFSTLQAKLENMRNAVLLLNKGVQTEGDAQRAMNEILTNLNDPALVKQRIGELRELNKRAAALRKSNVDLLRSNYGNEPLDYSSYENQPPTLGAERGVTVLPSADAIAAELKRRGGK